MRSDCNNCRKWKEHMYWMQFQMIQFFQILSGAFDQELVIPQKIAKSLGNKLEAYVSLTAPSGSTWKVELTATGDTLFLKNGWKEFVDAHSLEENDLLVFKYIGASRFDVSVFDSQSSCEKESSFYIKKCEHTDVASGSRTKRPIVVSNDTTNGVSEAAAIKKSKHASTPTSHTGKSFSCEEREAPATNKSKASTPVSAQTTNSSNSDDDYVVTERRNNKLASATTSRAQGTRRANVNMRSREIKSTNTRTGGGTSDQQMALELANAAATPESCVVVMKRSHIFGRCYMTVPSEWARLHLPRRSQPVILRYNETMCEAAYNHTDYGGALTGGWKQFCKDTFLGPYDVCVFNLVSGETENPILDVNIFRQ